MKLFRRFKIKQLKELNQLRSWVLGVIRVDDDVFDYLESLQVFLRFTRRNNIIWLFFELSWFRELWNIQRRLYCLLESNWVDNILSTEELTGYFKLLFILRRYEIKKLRINTPGTVFYLLIAIQFASILGNRIDTAQSPK